MKFKDIAKGIKSRTIKDVPMIDGKSVPVAIVPLNFDDEIEVMADARKFSIAKGVQDPKEGNPIYDRAMILFTLAKAAVDCDSPEDKPESFFESTDQIGKYMDPERACLMFHMQREWQMRCSPSPIGTDPGDFAEMVVSLALQEDDRSSIPFDYLQPETQRTFIRTMARLLYGSLTPKSDSGQESLEDLESSKNSAQHSESLGQESTV